ncbi:MAG: hypothetical protein ACIARR_11205 [Phycisphaerales bacterium JB059]
MIDVIREGIRKATPPAEETLERAKQAMKLDFAPRVISFPEGER